MARRQTLSPSCGRSKRVSTALDSSRASLSPTPKPPYNPEFTQRLLDELTAILWLGIRPGLIKTPDRFLESNKHLYSYFPEPPLGVTKKRPIQKWISNHLRCFRDPDDPSKFRKPEEGEVPTKEQAPDAYAFINKFYASRMSSASADSDDEVSASTPPKINQEPPTKPRATTPKPKPFVSDPPSFTPPKVITTTMSSDPPAKPDGVLNFDDIDFDTAVAYRNIYAANPDQSIKNGGDFIIWRTPDVKVSEGKNTNVVDKISILLHLGSESAVELTTRAYIEESGRGVIIYKPLYDPTLTTLWTDVKDEISALCERGDDNDDLPMLNAVSVFLVNFELNGCITHIFSARDKPHTGHQPSLSCWPL